MSTEYQVTYHTNYDKFVAEVNRMLEDNWVPLGGCTHSQGMFCQALIKQKEPLAVQDKPTAGVTKVTKKKVTKKRGPRKA